MRGADVMQEELFTLGGPDQHVPADHPLRRVRDVFNGCMFRTDTRCGGFCQLNTNMSSWAGARKPVRPAQSTRMPVSLTSLVHFAISFLMTSAHSSGVLPTASAPTVVSFCLTSAVLTIFTTS